MLEESCAVKQLANPEQKDVYRGESGNCWALEEGGMLEYDP